MNDFWIRSFSILVVFFALSLATPQVWAEVGDPTLRTDHPIYAGEGAFQTAADCAAFATSKQKSSQDKALALYLWLLTHQYHAASPEEWNVPGTVLGGDTESIVYDAARSRFSYGYGLCGTVHAWNEPYWKAAGFPARRRAFPGHTNSEIFYDDAWHAFDTDMAGLLFRRDGVVAGYDDIIRDPSLVDSVKPPLPHYPYAWPSDFNVMKQGWQTVAKEKKWYSLYNGGYEAHPGIVHLRSGESFTRRFDPDHYGGPENRRYWHAQAGGPRRDWTYVNAGQPRHDGAEANARGNASYCNGEFIYAPDLLSDAYREGTVAQSSNVSHGSQGLFSRDGEHASVVFRHFSPYVICGNPADDSQPLSSPATDGLVISGEAKGSVTVEVSADQGQTWQAKQPLRFPLDLTDEVKGRYGWQLRFSWSGDASIGKLRFSTTTQVSQSIYPRLKPGGTEVQYRAASRGVVPLLPNWGLAAAEVGAFEATELRSDNLEYQPRSSQQRLAYRTTNNRPAHVVFPLTAPHGLREIHAAARYAIRNPPPADHDFRLQVSTDGGGTWETFAQAEIPADNEFSSGWLSGQVTLPDATANKALIRVVMYAGGHQTGLIDFQAYGVYDTPPPQGTIVTYGWREGDQQRTHETQLDQGTAEATWTIPTGETVQDGFVTIRHAGGANAEARP